MQRRTTNSDARETSTGELFKRLTQQTSTLVRQEVDLAKAELAQKGKESGVGAGILGGSGVLALFGLAALTTAAIAALSEAMEVWAAALIVAAVYLAVAGVLALTGRNRLQEAAPMAPEQTIETMKEDVEWARNQAKSVRG
jgi:uncharacterized membrane protein YqjE